GRGAVEVVKSAPFWTARRARAAFTGLLVLVALVFAWALTLRGMVARRTRELAESIRQRETTRIEADASRRERLRLAADLHDGFQQYLAGAMFRLKAAMNYLPKDAENSRRQLEKVKDALQHTQTGLRSTLWAMNEESEGPESLTGLFRFVARRMPHWEGIVDIRGSGEERKVARKAAGTLLLVLQEAIGNAIRHGGARHVDVLVAFGADGLELSVSDDGCGFDASSAGAEGHYGMESMRRRTTELGGAMKVESSPGGGTRLSFSIPLSV
ncbi:MAG: sensor histidine kinase, partial [Kiritimatiellae bacterium]|nr:sensor histidine kinase [Kiritimatiellia bacterium]